ncbi:MAG: penicillin-binding protein 1A [Alphaproteobacteria bacterium]|nr:penicillin-binding protein 1A [Alphaproteobacteria bacterium]
MKYLSTLFSLFCVLCIAAFLGISLVVMHYSKDLPNFMQLANYEPLITTRLYTEDGQLLAEYATEKRIFIPETSIPTRLKQAFIAAEDKRFYTHNGIDPIGILRAVLVNLKNLGRRMEGGSTITQQVAKNFLLSSERSLSRKVREAILAMRIEKAFSKKHILELYLNEIYLGSRSYGVASAALNYFDKSLDELTLGEKAFLAALPKAPNNYNPLKHKQRALSRRNWVLERMFEDGYISKEELKQAIQEDIVIHMRDKEEQVRYAKYFSEEVRRQVTDMFGSDSLYQGGLSVRTSLRPNFQEIATKAFRKGILAYDKKHGYRGVLGHVDLMTDEEINTLLEKVEMPSFYPSDWQKALVLTAIGDKLNIALSNEERGVVPEKYYRWIAPFSERKKGSVEAGKYFKPGDVIVVQKENQNDEIHSVYLLQQYPEINGSMIVLDPHTGRVLSLVGGFSFKQSQFNRATQALRQPGSSIKPFVYMAALDSGYTPSSLILDAPIVLSQGQGMPKWKPKNYSKVFYGPTTLRIGLEKSRNLMTVRLARAIGMRKVAKYARKFGINENLNLGLSSALGTTETTLLRMATAYGMIVNGGKKIEPSFIDRIQDRSGKTIYKQDRKECLNCQGEEASAQELPKLIENTIQVENPVTAYQMVNILTGVIERGSGSHAKMEGVALAGKTGTSADNKDAWFIGFSPDLVVGVMVGFDTPKSLGWRGTGGWVSAPIFGSFMKKALALKPAVPFRVPQGVKFVRVNYKTGKPAAVGEKDVVVEAFKEGTDLTHATPVVGAEIETNENSPSVGGLY